MVFIHGYKDRPVPHGVTVDSDYSCPKCSYQGQLLTYALDRETTVYFVSLGNARRTGEGALACPACGNMFVLRKHKYRALAKITEPAQLQAALERISAKLESKRPLGDQIKDSLAGKPDWALSARIYTATTGLAQNVLGHLLTGIENGDASGRAEQQAELAQLLSTMRDEATAIPNAAKMCELLDLDIQIATAPLNATNLDLLVSHMSIWVEFAEAIFT